MAEHQWMRDEEARFIADLDAVFSGPLHDALAEIAAAFRSSTSASTAAIAPDGRLLLFEADAAMLVHGTDPPDLYPYKRAAFERIKTALTRIPAAYRSAASDFVAQRAGGAAEHAGGGFSGGAGGAFQLGAFFGIVEVLVNRRDRPRRSWLAFRACAVRSSAALTADRRHAAGGHDDRAAEESPLRQRQRTVPQAVRPRGFFAQALLLVRFVLVVVALEEIDAASRLRTR